MIENGVCQLLNRMIPFCGNRLRIVDIVIKYRLRLTASKIKSDPDLMTMVSSYMKASRQKTKPAFDIYANWDDLFSASTIDPPTCDDFNGGVSSHTVPISGFARGSNSAMLSFDDGSAVRYDWAYSALFGPTTPLSAGTEAIVFGTA
jgi:hypothetical protein